MDISRDTILEESLVEVYIVDLETRKYVYANKAALRNLGYTLEELQASTPDLVSPHLSLQELKDLIAPAIENPGHKPVILGNTHTRKDGSKYQVDAHLQFRLVNGRPSIVGFVFDASDKQKELDQLRQVIKSAKLGYWDFNFATDEYFVDENWLDMLGLVKGDVDEKNPEDWQRLIHPEDRDNLFESVDSAFQSRSSYTHEFRMLHKDGHVVWIQSCGAVVEWDRKENTRTRLCGTHLDITERKRNEQEKEQFLYFFEIASDIMVLVDPHGSFLKVNPATMRILGYSEEELLQKPFMEFIHEEDRPRTLDAVNEHLDIGFTRKFENRYLCKDGSVCWLSWSSSFDVTGGITYATARDITEQKKVEDKLKGQEEINRALIENSEDIIILYDRDHNYVYVNPALERILEIPRERFIGSSRENFNFSKELQEFWHDIIERVFSTGKSESQVYEVDTPSGRKKLLWNVFPGLRDNSGEITSVFGVSHNVTEHIKAEEELLRMERLESLGVLAGGIAHDFNNILTILFGNITTAKSQLAKPEEASNSLENAEKAFHRASNLTNQLLTFAKGGEPVKEELSLPRLVRETISFDLSGSNVKLEVQAEDNLWPAQADRGQVAQVFSNLAINANQAMPNGGTLHITLENREVSDHDIHGLSGGRYIVALIRDEGVGINPGELSRIFDPYYSTKQTGSGLGLTTVYSIINRHQGHIGVTSISGKGTTFEVFLPASVSQHVEKPAGASKEEKLSTRIDRILVMDDEDMICELAELILEKQGYQVDTASNGEDAVSLAKQAVNASSPYDCIIMDLTVPGGMGGKEAVEKILAVDPEAKIIVSSGYAVDPVMANFTDFGFSGVIIKPFTMKSLIEEVGKLVR